VLALHIAWLPGGRVMAGKVQPGSKHRKQSKPARLTERRTVWRPGLTARTGRHGRATCTCGTGAGRTGRHTRRQGRRH